MSVHLTRPTIGLIARAVLAATQISAPGTVALHVRAALPSRTMRTEDDEDEFEAPKLFPRTIERWRGTLEKDMEVAVENSTEAWFARSDDKRRWVHKTKISRGGLLAEAIGWHLCRELGVPIPNAMAVEVPGAKTGAQRWTWASEREVLAHWHPTVIPTISNLTIFAALVVLDAWLGNEDHHEFNLVLRPLDGDRSEIIALDFDAAWVGFPEKRATTRGVIPSPTLIIVPPPEVWRRTLPTWADRAREVAKHRLAGMVSDGCDLAGWADVDGVLSWLLHRQSEIGSLSSKLADCYERMES